MICENKGDGQAVCVRAATQTQEAAGEGRICTVLCATDCSGPVKASDAERTTSEQRKVGS